MWFQGCYRACICNLVEQLLIVDIVLPNIFIVESLLSK